MAHSTIRLFDNLENGADFELDAGAWSGTARKAVYRDTDSGDRLVLEGTNLKYVNGDIAGGKVTGFSYVDADGSKFYAVEDVKLSAMRFSGDDFLSRLEEIFITIFETDNRVIGSNVDDNVFGERGNDILFGRGGRDYLSGGKGRDVVTGGANADIFHFEKGWGKDTITDFHGRGDQGAMDHLDIPIDDIQSVTRSGKDTVIDFGDGDTLTFLDIRPRQIEITNVVE